MRTLDRNEIALVSGGEWEFEVDLGVTRFLASGPESVQEIAAGIGDIFSDAYWTGRDATADFYSWIASGWAYSASCGQVW